MVTTEKEYLDVLKDRLTGYLSGDDLDEISKKIDIAEGTIYPLLHRLKDEGLVTTYLQESGEGPPRKYYRLTESGRIKEHEQREEWVRFAASVNALLEGEPHGDN